MLKKLLLVIGLALMFVHVPARAEFGDVILNKQSEKNGLRPVVFPHWFHRIRFQCKVCHSELGIKMKAGATNAPMSDIMAGKFCGKCHDGKVAWGVDRCDLCHSGRPGLKTGVIGGDRTGGPGIF